MARKLNVIALVMANLINQGEIFASDKMDFYCDKEETSSLQSEEFQKNSFKDKIFCDYPMFKIMSAIGVVDSGLKSEFEDLEEQFDRKPGYRAKRDFINSADHSRDMKCLLWSKLLQSEQFHFQIVLEQQHLIHEAAKYGIIPLMRFLIEKRANMNVRLPNGATALHVAAQYGHVDVIEALQQVGANMNVLLPNGATALHVAAEFDRPDVIAALHKAGADMNQCSLDGATPLHFAAQYGHANVIKALQEVGANVNVRLPNGVTPLHFAAKHGHANVIKALQEVGANMNVRLPNGATAFHVAAECGRMDVIAALREAGANVDEVMSNGATALHMAAQYGHVDVIEALQQVGANMNVRLPNGQTALDLAIRYRHEDAIRVLRTANQIGRQNKEHTPDVKCSLQFPVPSSQMYGHSSQFPVLRPQIDHAPSILKKRSLEEEVAEALVNFSSSSTRKTAGKKKKSNK